MAVIIRTCKSTNRKFQISEAEAKSFEHFGLALPVLSPAERMRRLHAFHNPGRLFWRKCVETGQKLYSSYPAHAPFPVVAEEFWRSSQFKPASLGLEYQPKEGFIKQLWTLWKAVPRPATVTSNCTNCAAVHGSRRLDRCLVVLDSYNCRNVLYSARLKNCENCADCYLLTGSADCYECTNCRSCSMLRWSEHCSECSDSWFLSNCRDCTNCLFCANLTGKSFHIFNQQVSHEEYQTTLSQLGLHSRSGVENAKDQFAVFIKEHPLPSMLGDFAADLTGNYLYGVQGVSNSFECDGVTDSYGCVGLSDAKSCLDGYGFGGRLSQSAQFVSVGNNASRIKNCIECWDNVDELQYCSYCSNSRNLFGCVGLSNSEYCILNRQYSKSDYFELYGRIREQMINEGSWGDFFPAGFSAYDYNQSAANDWMPLSQSQATILKYCWNEEHEQMKPSLLAESVSRTDKEIEEVPQVTAGLEYARLQNIIFLCEMTGSPFQFTQQELALYDRLGVSPPSRSSEQRSHERLQTLGPRVVGKIKCAKTGKLIESAFPAGFKRRIVDRAAFEN